MATKTRCGVALRLEAARLFQMSSTTERSPSPGRESGGAAWLPGSRAEVNAMRS